MLLEVTNLSDSPGADHIDPRRRQPGLPRDEAPLQLAGGAARQFFLNLPAGSPPLRATLGDDALEIDNQVLLLPESTKPLRVLVDLADGNLRQAVFAGPGGHRPDRSRSPSGPSWRSATSPGAWKATRGDWRFSGAKMPWPTPDRSWSTTTMPWPKGLSLQNAIWSASPKTSLGGLPIVTAGNVTLLTESEDIAGRHRLQMPFVADLSNLQDMPDWPILFANLVRWRRGGLPGVAAPNVRLGQTVAVALARRSQASGGGFAVGEPPRSWTFAGGALPCRRIASVCTRSRRRTPSTSSPATRFPATNRIWPTADPAAGAVGATRRLTRIGRSSLSWVFLLVAMAAMAAHLAVVAKDSGRRGT